jgi:hypothetical protein
MGDARVRVVALLALAAGCAASGCARQPLVVLPPEASPEEMAAALQVVFMARRCWRFPRDAENLSELVVIVRARLDEAGALVGSPTVLNEGDAASPPSEALESARREALIAVVNCAPYDFLPAERYEDWREIDFRFDPTVMAPED